MSLNNLSLETSPRLVEATFTISRTVTSNVAVQPNSVNAHSEIVVEVASVDNYSGPYTVTPSQSVQTLHTKGLKTTNNIVINPIPSNYGRIEYDGATLHVI